LLFAKVLLLLWLGLAMGVPFILEQPKGSLMELHPMFQEFVKSNKVYRKYIVMQDFGAPTLKGTWLYSSMPWLGELDNYKSPSTSTGPAPEMVRKYIDASGKQCIVGGKDLKSSQSYPPG
jgi:hypothetical protein